MDGCVFGRFGVESKSPFISENPQNLFMNILPLPQSLIGKKVTGAKLADFPLTAGLGQDCMEGIPEFEIKKKIGLPDGKRLMSLIGLLFPSGRALTRILNAEGGGNNAGLAQGVMVSGRQNHPGNAGVQGQAGHQSPLG